MRKRYDEHLHHVHIEFANTGKLPSTLINIHLSSKDGNHSFGDVFLPGEAFEPHFAKKLPYVLNPGEVWSSRLQMEKFEDVVKHGSPEFIATFSHLKKPLKIIAPKAVNK